MKSIRILFLFLCLSLCFSASAQKGSNCPEDLVPKMGENRMFGFVNLMGEWRIEPVYVKVSPYVENMAVVLKGSSYGVIDCEGNVILPPKYEKLTNFRNGKIWAKTNGLWSYLDSKGTVIMEPQFTEINPVANSNYTWVKKQDLWGLYNEETRSFVCRPTYNVAQIMSADASLIETGEFYGVISHKNCSYIVQPKLKRVKKVARNTIIYKQDDGKWGAFSEDGKVLMNAQFDSIGLKMEDMLIVYKNGLSGLYNLKGKEVLPAQFQLIGEYGNGMFPVKKDDKYGYAAKYGKVIIKPQYNEAAPFINRVAVVKKENAGVIDQRNQIVIPFNYSEIIQNAGGSYFAAKQNTKFYLFDLAGKKITEESFDSVKTEDSTAYVRVKKEGKTSFYNINSKNYSFAGAFDQAAAFNHGFAFVSSGGRWGVINEEGKFIIPATCDRVEYDYFAGKYHFRTTINGKQGIVDNNGKQMLPNDYEMISGAAPYYFKLKKNGKWGLVKNTGAAILDYQYEFLSNSINNPGTPDWPAIAEKKGKFGLINEKGEELLPIKYNSVNYVGENLYSVSSGKNIGVFNGKGIQLVEPQFDEIRAFSAGFAAVRKGSKWGFINSKGDVVVQPQYDEVGDYAGRMAAVKMNGLWGLIDANGKMYVKPQYEDYKSDLQGRRFYKGGKEFKIQDKGALR